MHPHKPRPPPIRRIEKAQLVPMRIRAPRAHKDGLHGRFLDQVVCERGDHAFAGVLREGEVVVGGGGSDEGVNFGEGMRGDDVDGLEVGRERGVGGEGGEVED